LDNYSSPSPLAPSSPFSLSFISNSSKIIFHSTGEEKDVSKSKEKTPKTKKNIAKPKQRTLKGKSLFGKVVDSLYKTFLSPENKNKNKNINKNINKKTVNSSPAVLRKGIFFF
jgi:hypothetical protein